MENKIVVPKETQDRFDKLPGPIKDLLYSPTMSFIIQQVGQKNNLHIDQIDILNAEAGQVMMGYTTAEDFASSLAHGLALDQDKAEAVAKDINERLFSKIRAAMGLPSVSAAAVPAAPSPVSMPSAVKAPVPTLAMPPAAPAAPITPTVPTTPTAVLTPKAAPMPTTAPKPPAPVLMHEEAMLSGSTTSSAPNAAAPVPVSTPAPATPSTTPPVVPVAPIDPARPQNYKADPYREPVE